MESWIVWLIVAALLVVIEILTQMVWTLCLAVGCLGALVADLCGVNLPWQIVIMAMTSVVAYIVLMPLFKRWHDDSSRRQNHDSRTGMEALLGRRATVTEDVVPGQTGRARIDGDNWQVRAPGFAEIIMTGSEVVVTSFDGNILDVAPAPTTAG